MLLVLFTTGPGPSIFSSPDIPVGPIGLTWRQFRHFVADETTRAPKGIQHETKGLSQDFGCSYWKQPNERPWSHEVVGSKHFL
jgi:hypothetical protein